MYAVFTVSHACSYWVHIWLGSSTAVPSPWISLIPWSTRIPFFATRPRQLPCQCEPVVERPNHYADHRCYLVLRLRTSRAFLTLSHNWLHSSVVKHKHIYVIWNNIRQRVCVYVSCICVCMYVCIYVCMYVRMYRCMYVRLCMYVYVYMYV